MPGSRMSFGDGWLAAAIDDGRLVEVMPTFARPEMAYMQVVWDSTLARADTTSAHSCDGGMNGPAGDWYVALHARDSGRLLRYIEIPIAIPEEPVALDNHGYRWQADPAAPDRILKRKLNECEVVATIVLEGEPPMIDAGVAMAIGRDLRRGTEGFGAAVPELKSLPERHSWYRAIRVAQDDTVWVERMLSTAPFRRRVEIYESDGKQLAWLSPPTGLTLSRRSAITGDRVYGLMSDQDGIRYLAAFRIEKSPPPRELDEDSDGPALVGALSEVGRPGAVEMKQYNWRLPSALVEPSLQ